LALHRDAVDNTRAGRSPRADPMPPPRFEPAHFLSVSRFGSEALLASSDGHRETSTSSRRRKSKSTTPAQHSTTRTNSGVGVHVHADGRKQRGRDCQTLLFELQVFAQPFTFRSSDRLSACPSARSDLCSSSQLSSSIWMLIVGRKRSSVGTLASAGLGHRHRLQRQRRALRRTWFFTFVLSFCGSAGRGRRHRHSQSLVIPLQPGSGSCRERRPARPPLFLARSLA